MILLEKVRTLLGLRARWSPAPAELRPQLDEVASAWPFTDAAVAVSPPVPGVYLLYRDGRLIYIGLAVNGSGIRQELESHQGRDSCTGRATSFLCEPARDPLALHRKYLDAHRARYGGRLPPCNEREAGR